MELCEKKKKSGTERDGDHIPRKTKVGKQSKRRARPKPESHTRGKHGLGCLEAAPRQKPQGDESVSLDTERIKSLL